MSLPDYENGDHTYVRVNLLCNWEPEHGVEWVVRDARDVLYVGGGAGTWPEWLERGSRGSGYA